MIFWNTQRGRVHPQGKGIGGLLARIFKYVPPTQKRIAHTLAAMSVRYGGASATPRHYRFGVVAVGTRRSGTIPHTGGVVELTSAVPSPGEGTWIDAQFAPRMDNVAIRSYTGQGVQRRAIEIDAESIDWIDAPDTSPATDELLQARIGRLGVGDAILMDGNFATDIASGFSAEAVVNNTSCGWPSYAVEFDGTITIYYHTTSDNIIRERALSAGGWGAAVAISGGGVSWGAACIVRANGEKRVAYSRSSVGTGIVERVKQPGGTLGAESVISPLNGTPNIAVTYGETPEGVLMCAYLYEEGSRNPVYRIWNDDTDSWGGQQTINSGMNYLSGPPTLFATPDGGFSVMYFPQSSAVFVERIWNGSSWGAENPRWSAAGKMIPIRLVNNELRLYYPNNSNVVCYRVWSATGWGAEISLGLSSWYYPAVAQGLDGNIRLSMIRSSDSYLVERTLQRYAQLGAGIIESGSNANGSYIKFSDGTMICTGQWLQSPATSISNAFGSTAGTMYYNDWEWTFPVAFTTLLGLGSGGGGARAGGFLMSAESLTAATHRVWSANNSSTYYIYATAIGRW